MLLNLTELSPEPIHSQVVRQVRARILSGSLARGVTMPPRELARRHRVSARSVQKAFDDLATEGLVTAENDGAFAVAELAEDRRRDLIQQRLLEDLREREYPAKELDLARDIQCRLLPPPRLDDDGWTVVARNQPAHFVAGDFYDVLRHGDGSIDLVVADVAGKGIGPSLIMASVKAVLPFITVGRPVVDVLAELNRRLYKELGQREFVALALARFMPTTGRLELANAGLPDPYVLRREATGKPLVKTLEVPGERLPLGSRSRTTYTSITLTLEVGDRLLLLSDGMPEAETESGEPLGYQRLESRLAASHPSAKSAKRATTDPEAWLDQFLDNLRRATAIVQRDDWTTMVLERRR